MYSICIICHLKPIVIASVKALESLGSDSGEIFWNAQIQSTTGTVRQVRLTINNHFNASEVNLSAGFNAALASVDTLVGLPDPSDLEMVVIQSHETDCGTDQRWTDVCKIAY